MVVVILKNKNLANILIKSQLSLVASIKKPIRKIIIRKLAIKTHLEED